MLYINLPPLRSLDYSSHGVPKFHLDERVSANTPHAGTLVNITLPSDDLRFGVVVSYIAKWVDFLSEQIRKKHLLVRHLWTTMEAFAPQTPYTRFASGGSGRKVFISSETSCIARPLAPPSFMNSAYYPTVEAYNTVYTLYLRKYSIIGILSSPKIFGIHGIRGRRRLTLPIYPLTVNSEPSTQNPQKVSRCNVGSWIQDTFC